MATKRSRNVRRELSWATAGLCLGLVCFVEAPTARANVLTSIGSFFGAPLGGLINAATAPAIANVDGTADRLVANVDTRVNTDIDHAGQLVSTTVSKAEDQADGILNARIAQVIGGANTTISVAVSDVNALEQKTVNDEQNVINQVNKDVQQRLDDVDKILDTHITQINGVVTGAIGEADQDVKARIEQADEVAQKALGSADVLASKEMLNLQQTLLRVGALLGMVAFLVAAFRFIFDNLPEQWAAVDAASESAEKWRHRRRFAALSLTSLGVHALGCVAMVGVFLALAKYLPSNAEKSQQALTSTHSTALNASYAALDFTKVRYHAAELAILDPAGESRYRAIEKRADLIRAVLTRPGLLASDDGVRQLALLVDAATLAQSPNSAGVSQDSPDVIAATGYICWQLARTRTEELRAVGLFAQALDANLKRPPADRNLEPFVLAPLAAEYVRFYVERPITSPAAPGSTYTADQLAQLAASQTATFALSEASNQFDHAVLELDRSSTAAYLAMLDAQAALPAPQHARSKPAPPELPAQKARTEAAAAVRDAWLKFDRDTLLGDSTLPNAARMAVFSLNDVPLSQALWVLANPSDFNAPPALGAVPDPRTRWKIAPIRITWASRYLNPLAQATQLIAAHEVSSFYRADETRTIAFEQGYLNYKRARTAGDPAALGAARDTAATAAAALGFYTATAVTRVPLGEALLDAPGASAPPGADVRSKVQAANDAVRLRLL
jgi:hypothetical protein